MEEKVAKLKSFVPDADNSLFPLENLPYGVFTYPHSQPHIGVAIGNHILDLTTIEQAGLLNIKTPEKLFDKGNLNFFASQGANIWLAVRSRLQSLLSSNNPELQRDAKLLSQALIYQKEVDMLLPFKIEGFSDFYASEHHATNVGKLFRGKENALLPNWKYLPVGYNGRASTVFVSGTSIKRPKGQIKLPTEEKPLFVPSRKLDFELEMGIFIGVGNADGHLIPCEKAHAHIFGLVLLNDWSARDIQAFEYQPLGPFLSKSFATSISPWVVSMAALQNTMVPLPPQHPECVEYLQQPNRHLPNIKLKVEILPKGATTRTVICETNVNELYWTLEQMLAHHTVNNCIMRTGDLLGTGTISGPQQASWGSLLEITFNGTQPLKLNDGNERSFLEDGDSIIFTGYCETAHGKIGFGCLEGTITSVK